MDVETILNQIRERVVAEESPRLSDGRLSITESPANGSAANENHEALLQIDYHLAVTSRAWDRLPPIHSNRHGLFARIELWFKKASKRLTRWFSWELVHFNRATNDAFSDISEMLKTQLSAIHQLRSHQAEQLRTIEATFDQRLADILQRHSQLANEHFQLANQVVAIRAEQRGAKAQQDEEINRRLAELVAELKEEQRVCFRQLSLEAGESAVLEDRARRSLLARLEKVEAALKATSR